MPDESPLEIGACPFCERAATRHTLLHEGRDFYVIADFAPVAEAHLLLIPHEHLPHLAALPVTMEDEFLALKSALGRFVCEQYGKLTFWENGVFGQSVPHAHLHVIAIELDALLLEGYGRPFDSFAEMQQLQGDKGGHYFMVEHGDARRFLPPEPEIYGRIIRHARERNGGIWRYGAADRRVHGKEIVEGLVQRWREWGEKYLIG